MRPTDDFKDKFVAPEISSFTEASIPDLSELQQRWLVSFILNGSLVVQLDDATRRTLYNFLRRAEASFREYSSARQMTMAHLTNPRPDAVSEYIIAIGHWEAFLSQTYPAWCLLARGQPILHFEHTLEDNLTGEIHIDVISKHDGDHGEADFGE